MKKVSSVLMTTVLLLGTLLQSCQKNKILLPNDQITASKVYSTADGYKMALAKVYGAFALTGNNGPANMPDVLAIDEGTSDFYRLFWCAQELPTDEAVIGWGDPGLPDLHTMSWSSSNLFLEGIYYRSTYQITLCNEFIRQSSDANIKSRNLSAGDAANIRNYRAEARFLRAYQYWVMMDLFGNPPFATEKDAVGSIPTQTDRKTLYTYVVNELKSVDSSLVGAKQNEYGRADRAAAWALLSRVALNAGVYTGTADYATAITYAAKVINAGYSLIPNYQNLMLADNNKNTSEFIMTINYDGNNTQGYGGSTFMVHAPVGGTMPSSSFGISGGWAGLRTTSSLVNLFPVATTKAFPSNNNADTRAQFWADGQNLSISNVSAFTDGYAITKYRNVTSAGGPGSNLNFSDIDMPVFRLPEMYLIYAEATLRGGAGGNLTTALGYMNTLRTRAYGGSTAGNITASALTIDFILDERARELYWEGFRRTDLIRYNRFVENSYLWPFKGGIKAGTGVAAYRTLYPLPFADLNVNPNLKQNAGY